MGAPLTGNDNCINNVVDSLQMIVHKIDQHKYAGATSRTYAIGDFWFKTNEWIISSDSTKENLLSFFVRFRGNLWGYIVSTSGGLWLVLFDGSRAKIRVGATDEFGTGSIKDTLVKLKGMTRESYRYDQVNLQWEEFDVMGMLTK